MLSLPGRQKTAIPPLLIEDAGMLSEGVCIDGILYARTNPPVSQDTQGPPRLPQ